MSKWAADYQPTMADIAATDARVLAIENGETEAAAQKIAAEAAKAYTDGANPQAVAYSVFDKNRSASASDSK